MINKLLKVTSAVLITGLVFLTFSKLSYAAQPGKVYGYVRFQYPNGAIVGAPNVIVSKQARTEANVTSKTDANGYYLFQNTFNTTSKQYQNYLCYDYLGNTRCKNDGQTSSSMASIPACDSNQLTLGYSWCGSNCGLNPHSLKVIGNIPVPKGYVLATLS